MKATAISHPNIAFIKYWGQKDAKNLIPYTDTISMTLADCQTQTTVEFSDQYSSDRVEIWNESINDFQLMPADSIKNKAVYAQIRRLADRKGVTKFARVMTKNNFPTEAGIASSASGICSLTVALAQALDLQDLVTDPKELSRLVRLGGSVSAVRSVYGGFVSSCNEDNDCYAAPLAAPDHWDLVDIVAIVDRNKKPYSSSFGHTVAETSPYWAARLAALSVRIRDCRRALEQKNLEKLGPLIEVEALCMHRVMQTSTPPIDYFMPGTRAVIEAVKTMRSEGLPAYFTIDAGPNVHVICEQENALQVQARLRAVSEVQQTFINPPGPGFHFSDNHLF